jgi:fibronectin-binding autotransporter adhesin
MTLRALLAAVLTVFGVLGSGPAAVAQTYYWDGGNAGSVPATGGAGTWDLSTVNWVLTDPTTGTPTAYGNEATATAIFGGPAGAVTVGAPVNVNQLQFTVTGYTFTSSGAGNTITLSGTAPSIAATTGTVTKFGTSGGNAVLSLTSAGMTISGGGEVILASPLSGSTGTTITVTGGSILTLGDRTVATTTPAQLYTVPNGNSIVLNGSTLQLASTTNPTPPSGTIPSLVFSGNSTVSGYRPGRTHLILSTSL